MASDDAQLVAEPFKPINIRRQQGAPHPFALEGGRETWWVTASDAARLQRQLNELLGIPETTPDELEVLLRNLVGVVFQNHQRTARGNLAGLSQDAQRVVVNLRSALRALVDDVFLHQASYGCRLSGKGMAMAQQMLGLKDGEAERGAAAKVGMSVAQAMAAPPPPGADVWVLLPSIDVIRTALLAEGIELVTCTQCNGNLVVGPDGSACVCAKMSRHPGYERRKVDLNATKVIPADDEHLAHAGHGTWEETSQCACAASSERDVCAEAGCYACANPVPEVCVVRLPELSPVSMALASFPRDVTAKFNLKAIREHVEELVRKLPNDSWLRTLSEPEAYGASQQLEAMFVKIAGWEAAYETLAPRPGEIAVGGEHMDTQFRIQAYRGVLLALVSGKDLTAAIDAGKERVRAWVREWNAKREWQVHRSLETCDPLLEDLHRAFAKATYAPPVVTPQVVGWHVRHSEEDHTNGCTERCVMVQDVPKPKRVKPTPVRRGHATPGK